MNTILFDLDGTLLPMDQDVFLHEYFVALTQKFAPFGYEPRELVRTVTEGTYKMVGNDGARTNREVFWASMSKTYSSIKQMGILFDEFYNEEFVGLKRFFGYSPQAGALVHSLKCAGYTLALATNPIFTMQAQINWLEMAGVDPAHFALITSYEESHYCKPCPAYYTEICDKLGVKPKDCLMVGNDAAEDGIARKTGMDVFLLTDCLINTGGADINKYPHGSYAELNVYIKKYGDFKF